MDNRKLLQLSRALQHKSLAEVDEALRRQHLDASERLAVKLQLQASAAPQGRTVRAGGRLVTDAPGQELAADGLTEHACGGRPRRAPG